MNKDITYSSYATTPADYRCPDGQLAAALNLINEDGALRPISAPRTLHSGFGATDRVFIHRLPDDSYNYVCYRASTKLLYWLKSDFTTPTNSTITSVDALYSLAVIGNTLALATPAGLVFVLWSDSAYTFLGSRPPRLYVEFGLTGTQGNGLRGRPDEGDKIELRFPGISDNARTELPRPAPNLTPEYVGEESVNIISTAVLGGLLSYIADNVTAKGRFVDPFFVRFAYRLYDGSYYWQSCPVLMTPNACGPMLRISKHGTTTDNIPYVECYYDNAICSLAYRVLPFDKNQWRNWSDIIKGIDVFISAPLQTYDQSADILGIRARNVINNIRVTEGTNTLFNGVFSESKEAFKARWVANDSAVCSDRCFHFAAPKKSFAYQISHTSVFYHFATLSNDVLTKPPTATRSDNFRFFNHSNDDGTSVDLSNLLTRPTLPDDFSSQRELTPSYLFSYNNRLQAANLLVTPPLPTPLKIGSQALTDLGEAGMKRTTAKVWLRKSGVVISRSLPATELTNILDAYDLGVNLTDFKNFPFFIYYPDPDAFKIEIRCDSKYLTLPLTSHELFNGAYWSRFDEDWATGTAYSFKTSSSETDGAPTYCLPSSIYSSEVNNPFIFNPSAVCTVGSGAVLALSTAAKALSQGQFGQFPLYAFTDEGIWALEVSSTGVYSARQPITRDVCHNIAGITQIDSAVLFPSDRGIMLLSGSQTTCISEAVDSSFPFDLSTLPSLVNLQDTYLTRRDPLSLIPFPQFIAGAFIIYDYPHQRIIVSNPSCDYAYVYSFKSKAWGLLHSDIARPVISYPDALALTAAGDLVSYSDNDDSTSDSDSPFRTQFLVTRPLTLDAPDTLKTIDNIIQRGYFRKGHVRSLLYGSRDLINWYLVTSSQNHHLRGFRGTPYKYFRIAAIATLNADESIFGASVQFEPRYTNKPR